MVSILYSGEEGKIKEKSWGRHMALRCFVFLGNPNIFFVVRLSWNGLTLNGPTPQNGQTHPNNFLGVGD